jgi:hypothetical protein
MRRNTVCHSAPMVCNRLVLLYDSLVVTVLTDTNSPFTRHSWIIQNEYIFTASPLPPVYVVGVDGGYFTDYTDPCCVVVQNNSWVMQLRSLCMNYNGICMHITSLQMTIWDGARQQNKRPEHCIVVWVCAIQIIDQFLFFYLSKISINLCDTMITCMSVETHTIGAEHG